MDVRISQVAILSVTDATTTPSIMLNFSTRKRINLRLIKQNNGRLGEFCTYIATVTRTGLSPEFHLAFFKIGRAGSFLRPPPVPGVSFNQSEKSQRSKPRPSPLDFSGCGLSPTFSSCSEYGVSVDSEPSKLVPSSFLRPSKYSRTSAEWSANGRSIQLARINAKNELQPEALRSKRFTREPTAPTLGNRQLGSRNGNDIICPNDTSRDTQYQNGPKSNKERCIRSDCLKDLRGRCLCFRCSCSD